MSSCEPLLTSSDNLLPFFVDAFRHRVKGGDPMKIHGHEKSHETLAAQRHFWATTNHSPGATAGLIFIIPFALRDQSPIDSLQRTSSIRLVTTLSSRTNILLYLLLYLSYCLCPSLANGSSLGPESLPNRPRAFYRRFLC